MSEHLDRLHAAVYRQGQRFEQRVAAWRAYQQYAVQVADAPPFAYRLIGCVNTSMPTSKQNGRTHIVTQQPISQGRLMLSVGDALCAERWRFNGSLTDVRPNEEGATCHDCVRISERLSLVEWRAS